MRTRLTIGPLLVGVILVLVFLDFRFSPANRPFVSGLIALLALLGWRELAAMAGFGPRGDRQSLSLFFLGLLGIAYFHLAAWWTADPRVAEPVSYEAAALVGLFALILASFTLVVFRGDFLQHYQALLETVLGVTLLGLLFSYSNRVYNVEQGGFAYGLVLFAGIKGTDSAAYLVGSKLGRHRFLPVTPKKSLEGCLAGVLWGALWFGTAPAYVPAPLFPWWQGALFGIILAVVAQIGDFTESLIKRKYQAKDSQALLPEFGGILDMVDSLIFAGYLFFCFIP